MENRNASNVFMTLFIQNNNEVRLASSTISYLAQIESFFEFFYADDLARVQVYWFSILVSIETKTSKFYFETLNDSVFTFKSKFSEEHPWMDRYGNQIRIYPKN